MKKTYFEWLKESTPTTWWHDSGNPDEIKLAKERGALGVTTNPVLTYRTFLSQPEFWEEKVDQISQDLGPEQRAEALLRLVATYAADCFADVYKATEGKHGYALGQLNPSRAGDYEGMLAQARRVHSWAPNIAVKIPTTRSGVEVIEQIASEGIPICATLNVSVSQAISVAEAYERGIRIAKEKGIIVAPCLVVQQVGRIDDYLREVASDMKLNLSESVICSAGTAIAKRSYEIFRERGYSSIIMPAGLRGPYHLTELAGADMIFTINTRVQNMIIEDDNLQEERINIPIDKDIIDKLMLIPEFVRAYEPDSLKPKDYITFGVVQKLLSQFTETGWAPLETYKSTKVSSRWI